MQRVPEWLAKALGLKTGARRPNSELERRIARFTERLERTPFDAVRLMAVRATDPAAVGTARERAEAAVSQAGLARTNARLRSGVDAFAQRALDGQGFDPGPLGIAWRHEPLRPEDRILLLAVLRDAALAVVARDVVDEGTYDELIGPCVRLVE